VQFTLREVEKHVGDLWAEHLRELLTEAELNGGEPKVQRRIKILIQAQCQRQYFQHLKKIFKPQTSGGLSLFSVTPNVAFSSSDTTGFIVSIKSVANLSLHV
jgi:hypothetical protein